MAPPRGRFFAELGSDGPLLSFPGSECTQQADEKEDPKALYTLPTPLCRSSETENQLRHFAEFEGFYNQEGQPLGMITT